MQRSITYQVGAANPAARAATVSALYSQIMYILPMLYAAGFPKSNVVTTYAIAQMMLESDWMTSNVANTDNNYSGINYINKTYQDATKGLAKPKGEGGGNYAHFKDFAAWAKDFKRILSLNIGGKGRPINATTSQEYVDRLKANGYFTSDHYYTAFNAALKKVNEALNYGQGQDKNFNALKDAGQNTFVIEPGKGLPSTASDNQNQNQQFKQQATDNKMTHWIEDREQEIKAALPDVPWGKIGLAAAGLFILTRIFK